MTLRTRIFSFNLISVLLATFVVAVVGLKIVESTVIDSTYERLTQTRIRKTTAIQDYFRDLQLGLNLISFHQQINNLLQDSSINSYPELRQLLDKYSLELNIYDIILLNAHGKITYSSRKDLTNGTSIHENLPSENKIKNLFFWAMKAQKDAVLFLDFSKDPFNHSISTGYFASTISQKNKFMGLVILKISSYEIDRITSHNFDWSKSGMGQSGETLIFGQDWSLRNTGRFAADKGSPPLGDENIKKIESQNEILEMGVDYRQQKVLRNIGKIILPNGDIWFIETKMDKSEAFAVLDRIAIASAAAGVLIFILFFFVTFAAAGKVLEPIQLLTDRLEKLGTSNLSQEIRYTSKDEIGLLVDKYNQVANRLETTTVSKDFLDSVIQSINALLFIVKINPQEDWKKSSYLVTQANETALKYLGLSPQQLVQSDLRDLIRTDPEFRNYSWLLKTHHSIEAEITNSDYEVIPVLVNWAVLPDHPGEDLTFVFVCTDIKDRIAAEQALIEAREQAEEASLAKSEFLARMSHEIRTPLNAIIGITDILAESDLKPEQAQMTNVCKNAGENLLVLVNDILDMAKIEAGEIQLERIAFNIESTTKTLCEIFKHKANEKKLPFNLNINLGPESHNVIADPTRLRQILFNLIGNSIKFTDKGEISVNVEFDDSEKRFIRFSVKDTGVGIPFEKQHLIFQSFSQADSSITRKFGGSGLGLAISKNLVELMGGSIWFESEQGKGSNFHFTIPFVLDEVSQKSTTDLEPKSKMLFQPSDMKPPKKKPRILIVDDTDDNRFLLLTYLKNLPFDVIEAENGQDALDKIFHDNIDLVLMDIQMPIMDGYEATRRIRSWEAEIHKKHVPIIAVSANAMLEDMQRSLDVGCSEHLIKPIKKTALLEMIQKYIS